MLNSRVAVVTGGTGGLGPIIAHQLASAGAHVVIVFLTQEDKANDLARDLSQSYNVRSLAIRCDVSSEPAVERMMRTAIEEFGQLDILVNAAGVSRDRITWRMSLDDWEEPLRVNLTGTFLCCKHALPAMRERSWGRIINLSSVVAQVGVPGTVAYAASKAGLFGLTRTIAQEVAQSGITVNCLSLGYFEAGMLFKMPEAARTAVLSHIPMGRFGDPEDVGAMIVYLCSEYASYITGQVIELNGGLHV